MIVHQTQTMTVYLLSGPTPMIVTSTWSFCEGGKWSIFIMSSSHWHRPPGCINTIRTIDTSHICSRVELKSCWYWILKCFSNWWLKKQVCNEFSEVTFKWPSIYATAFSYFIMSFSKIEHHLMSDIITSETCNNRHFKIGLTKYLVIKPRTKVYIVSGAKNSFSM